MPRTHEHDVDHESEDPPEVAPGPFDLPPVFHPDEWDDAPQDRV